MVEFRLSESPSTQIIYQVQGNVGDGFFVQDSLTTHKLSLYLVCLDVVLTRSVVRHSFVTRANRSRCSGRNTPFLLEAFEKQSKWCKIEITINNHTYTSQQANKPTSSMASLLVLPVTAGTA